MTEKKYELTDETIEVSGKTLHRIIALGSVGDVPPGALGGFIESERNLSHLDNAWIDDNACVFGGAWCTAMLPSLAMPR